MWRSQSHVGVDSDLIKGLKTWIQKQVFDDFSTVVGETDKEINQIVYAADTLAIMMELGIESEVCSVNKQIVNIYQFTKNILNNFVRTTEVYIYYFNFIVTD